MHLFLTKHTYLRIYQEQFQIQLHFLREPRLPFSGQSTETRNTARRVVNFVHVGIATVSNIQLSPKIQSSRHVEIFAVLLIFLSIISSSVLEVKYLDKLLVFLWVRTAHRC